jgi:hypothetical protein
MAIDTDGNLKVAVFGGSKVLKIYGSEPEVLLEVVEMLSYEQIWTNCASLLAPSNLRD